MIFIGLCIFLGMLKANYDTVKRLEAEVEALTQVLNQLHDKKDLEDTTLFRKPIR